MATIHKQRLASIGIQQISVPMGAEMLHVAEQQGYVCIWYRCDPYRAVEFRNIAIVGTGDAAPDDGKHIGTVLLTGGSLVVHVFEQRF